ncbi:MAG TPA: SgcJ/EcaC family oxidoreductase [Pirellulales bacterium]|nr:SgcJ/EcaC family oxidoreductase [Pirellulales bacterium]
MPPSATLTRPICIGALCAITAAGIALGQAGGAAEPAGQTQSTQIQSTRPQSTQPQANAATQPSGQLANAEESADETAIRAVVAAFSKDYNAGDAKAIASLFIPEGEIVAEDGTTHQGRDAIEAEFVDIFKEHPKTTIKDDIANIHFLSPTLAVETGTSLVTHDREQPAERERYEAVHVKQNGQWRMATARDLSEEQPSGVDQLQQLHWLIGDWIDESPDSVVHTSYRWSDDHHYILGDFSANFEGKMAIKGTQRFGWDPLAKTIRSWSFDSEGGFVDGTWTHEGNQWIIKTAGVTSDGKAASSTNYLTHLHKHRMTWESRDRLVGGEKTPDIGPITIVRQAPAPGVSTSRSSAPKKVPESSTATRTNTIGQ